LRSLQVKSGISFSIPEPEVKEKDEVTMEEFKKIKNGMTYEEIVKIIGFEGIEMSSTEIGGIKLLCTLTTVQISMRCFKSTN
jgi:aspartokinase